jgi:uncharacterized membrane protein YkoI
MFSAAAALCTASGVAQAQAPAQATEKFESVKVYFEQNLRDKDAEVKFEATGGDVGLATLTVTAPDGRVVIDFKAGNSKLGMRHLTLESPEPKNDGRVQKDFPAGIYKFAGTTVAGAKLQGQASLSHVFPAPASFVRPRADEKDIPAQGLKLSWNAVKNTASTVVLIEHEKSGRFIRVNLPGDATTFAVPDGFLQPGTEYKLAIGTVTKEGNASFIETGFTTATLAAGSAAAALSAAATGAGGAAKGGAKVISEDEAKKIAVKAVPGKATDIAVEKKLGANRYVVEVQPAAGGKELDVVIDMTSGKVLAVEK